MGAGVHNGKWHSGEHIWTWPGLPVVYILNTPTLFVSGQQLCGLSPPLLYQLVVVVSSMHAVRPHSKRRIPSRQLPLCLPSQPAARRHRCRKRFRIGGCGGSECGGCAGRRRPGEGVRRQAAVGRVRAAGDVPELRARLHGRVRPAAARHPARRPDALHYRHHRPHRCRRPTAKDQGSSNVDYQENSMPSLL